MRFFRPIASLKGWRRFGFEVAIIIVGLSITLIAQELLTDASRTRATRQAAGAVEAEVMTIFAFASERLALEPCRRQQISTLAAQLRNSSDTWNAQIPENINNNADLWVLPRMYRMPMRPWRDASWTAFLASDASVYFDRERFADLSGIFVQAQTFNERQEETLRLAGDLSHLALSGPISAAQRRETYALLSRLTGIEALLAVRAEQIRDSILSYEFESDQRFARFAPGGDFDLAGMIAADRATTARAWTSRSFSPSSMSFNATTGLRFTIPAAP